MAEKSIFVSGATGYIALTLVKKLIEKGYNVVGSVRSTEKGENLKRLLASPKFSYEVVQAIESEGAFDEALKKHPEVTVFLHTASPFHFNTTDIEKDLLLPAINGTTNAFNAIKTYGPQIRRVVLTSSLAAIFEADHMFDPTRTYDETSWNPITYEESKSDPFKGYVGSKKLAEKAAWDFVELERPGFTLTVVNPVYVLGPQPFDENIKTTLNTSAEVVNSLMKLNKSDDVPNIAGYYIDVRDVADAHIVGFENPKALNQRLFTAAGEFDSQLILDIIHENFPELADRLPKGNKGSSSLGKAMKINDEKTREVLGFKYTDIRKIVVDSVDQILRANKE